MKGHLRQFTGYADVSSLSPKRRGCTVLHRAGSVPACLLACASHAAHRWLQDKMKGKAEATANGLKMGDLKYQLTMCDLELAGKKDELVERLVNFLAKPAESGKKSLADKADDKKAKAAAKKERLAAKKKRNANKREKAKKKKERESKKKAAAKKKRKKDESDDEEESESEDEASDDDDEEEESEEEEEPPKKKKAKKAKKVVESSDSDDDAPIGSLNKPKVTDALLTEKVAAMAKESGFEELSLKLIREKLAEELGQDMYPYKKQIKAVVVACIAA